MHVLLDESLPRQLAREIAGHEVRTVRQAGWTGKKNGELLLLASVQFDAFPTADQNLEFQQELSKYQLLILVLVAQSNRLVDLKPLVPKIQVALENVKSGHLVRITA